MKLQINFSKSLSFPLKKNVNGEKSVVVKENRVVEKVDRFAGECKRGAADLVLLGVQLLQRHHRSRRPVPRVAVIP